MRILGHPVHPMLVHFPIAFLSLAALCDVCAYIDVFVSSKAYGDLFLILGVVSALPAGVTGFFDYVRLPNSARRDGDYHVALMSIAWMAFLCALMLRFETNAKASETISVVFSVVGLLLLCAGGFYGGKLVYHHGAGARAAKDEAGKQNHS